MTFVAVIDWFIVAHKSQFMLRRQVNMIVVSFFMDMRRAYRTIPHNGISFDFDCVTIMIMRSVRIVVIVHDMYFVSMNGERFYRYHCCFVLSMSIFLHIVLFNITDCNTVRVNYWHSIFVLLPVVCDS